VSVPLTIKRSLRERPAHNKLTIALLLFHYITPYKSLKVG